MTEGSVDGSSGGIGGGGGTGGYGGIGPGSSGQPGRVGGVGGNGSTGGRGGAGGGGGAADGGSLAVLAGTASVTTSTLPAAWLRPGPATRPDRAGREAPAAPAERGREPGDRCLGRDRRQRRQRGQRGERGNSGAGGDAMAVRCGLSTADSPAHRHLHLRHVEGRRRRIHLPGAAEPSATATRGGFYGGPGPGRTGVRGPGSPGPGARWRGRDRDVPRLETEGEGRNPVRQ